MKRILISLLLLFPLTTSGQTDNVGSGRALLFDGVDDYISLGDQYDEIPLPVSVTAWIKLDPSVSNWVPIFVTQDNRPIYNGFWVIVQPTRLSVGYGDGFGENDPIFRRSKIADVQTIAGRWVHVAITINSALDMSIYINGLDVGGYYTGDSSLPMSASPLDIAKIGYWYSNGQTLHFKGMMDEVRFWSRTITETEIRTYMCRSLPLTDPGLVGLWTFNETSGNTVTDLTSRQVNGTMLNGVTRVYSAAPIGDESSFLYPSVWDGKSLTHHETDYNAIASNIRADIGGVHLYSVRHWPSQVDGLPASPQFSSYFGVFVATPFPNSLLDLSIEPTVGPICSMFGREDNSRTPWTTESDLVDIPGRREVIFFKAGNLDFTLGGDTILCDNQLFIRHPKPNIDDTYLWSTGENTPSIKVTTSGMYWLNVTNVCGSATDSIRVKFSHIPDIMPNVITPNGDGLNDVFKFTDDNDSQVLLNIINRWGDTVFESPSYDNSWSGNDLSTGVYYYVVDFPCHVRVRGPVSIIR